jgi:ferric-dicitrate binding protein FerR (iron transport regulator)
MVTPPQLLDALRTYTTGAGQIALVELADGSHIIIAPRTTVVIDTVNQTHARVVTLRGEAHFEVANSARTPFVVRTGSAATRVLGTTFDVRWYPGDATGRVTVSTGKVVIGTRTNTLTLIGGMTGTLNDSAVNTTYDVDTKIYIDWKHRSLVFRDVPVLELLATLHRWYGYEFRLADSTLAEQHVTAELSIGETTEMLNAMKHILEVSMEISDSVVTLHHRRNVNGVSPDKSHPIRFLNPLAEVGR